MAPYPHRHSSFSDDSEAINDLLSADGDVVGSDPPKSPRHHNHGHQRVQVPRSTQRELASSNASRRKKISDDLPGFSDWRNDNGAGGDDRQQRRGDKDRPPPSSTSRRKKSSRHQRRDNHSSSFNSSGDPVTREAKSIRDIESDVLSRPPSTPSSSRSRVSSRRSSQDADESLPSIPSIPSVETTKFNNTTRATMNKYKQLYEAMLRDAEEKKGDARWTGLGDIHEEGSGPTGNNNNGAVSLAEHNKSVVSKGSYYSGSSDGSNATPSSNGGQDQGKKNTKIGSAHSVHAAKKSSFHSTNTGRDDGRRVNVNEYRAKKSASFHGVTETSPSSPFQETKGKVFTPNRTPSRPSIMLLEDSMISGLNVEEVLYEDAADSDPSLGVGGAENIDESASRLATDKNPAANANGLEDAPKSPKQKANASRSRNRSGHHDPARLDIASERSRDDPGGRSGKPSEKKSCRKDRSRGDPPPPVDKHGGGRRDRSRTRRPSSDASVGSQRSNRSGKSSQSNRSGGSRFSFSRSRSNSRQRSSSRQRSDSRSSRRPSFSGSARDDDSISHHTKATQVTATSNDTTNTGRKKRGLFRKVKKLAGMVVKTTLGVHGVHKYRVGEFARYRVAKVPSRCLDKYDPETRTVEVEIIAVHVDAVLDMPYYTIGLPDGACKQTNWDNLMPLEEYEKRMANPHSIPRDEDRHAEPSSWKRSLSRTRGSSRQRSSSRHSGRGHPQADDDDRSAASNASRRSSRSNASHRSSRSDASRRSSSSRGGGGRRPRSRSPYHSREGQRQQGDGRRSRSDRGEGSPSSDARGTGGRPDLDRQPSGRSRRR